jgi:hypothetical protein
MKPVFFALISPFILAASNLHAGTVSLLPDEIVQLRSLVATHPGEDFFNWQMVLNAVSKHGTQGK